MATTTRHTSAKREAPLSAVVYRFSGTRTLAMHRCSCPSRAVLRAHHPSAAQLAATRDWALRIKQGTCGPELRRCVAGSTAARAGTGTHVLVPPGPRARCRSDCTNKRITVRHRPGSLGTSPQPTSPRSKFNAAMLPAAVTLIVAVHGTNGSDLAPAPTGPCL